MVISLDFIMKKLSECDADADLAIATMISAIGLAALSPAALDWALVSGAMGVGCVAIGRAYGVQLTKDEAWKLIKQFFLSTGSMFLAINVGSKLLASILKATGFGYGVGVVLDVAFSIASAYAVGACAKEYFRNDYQGKKKLTKEELGRIFREEFKKHKK